MKKHKILNVKCNSKNNNNTILNKYYYSKITINAINTKNQVTICSIIISLAQSKQTSFILCIITNPPCSFLYLLKLFSFNLSPCVFYGLSDGYVADLVITRFRNQAHVLLRLSPLPSCLFKFEEYVRISC